MTKMIRITLMTLCLAAAPALAQSVGAGGAAELLSKRLSDYQSYQADFEQTVQRPDGERLQRTTGQLSARRGGDFFWYTDPPMEQKIVTAGDQVRVYDPDLRQVTIYPLEDRIASTPALLLSGEVGNLAETFRVRHEKEGDGERFILKPREQGALFLKLSMRFDEAGVLRQMQLHDSLDQLSKLQFRNVVLNETVPDDRFELDAPDDVDVIRNKANGAR
ncbi:outer membrane lipoprotein chaperone LolA [Salicola sp. Rm-C-2C1-2]|uniref:outer membrane lipoprotein chaperone LolA n=1 Tax=Salicola sp. Rm-C-2C1-2 TaxID=3141321 RepID=UPI0032E4D710